MVIEDTGGVVKEESGYESKGEKRLIYLFTLENSQDLSHLLLEEEEKELVFILRKKERRGRGRGNVYIKQKERKR